ncbi:MAG: transaldolase [Pseudomonadota bacterium]
MSRIQSIGQFKQQIWLDNLSRELIDGGKLTQWIKNEGITGITSNPAIFHNAISQGAQYQTKLSAIKTNETDLERRFESLVLPDIIDACQLLRPLYEQSHGEMGYVSFEVSPKLAHDAAGTVAAARRLWAEINQPNLMIKIPATAAGVIACEEVIAEGINVNVTLMFSEKHVNAIFAAYQRGLKRRLEKKLPLSNIHSVASVFISRVDVKIDALLPANLSHLKGQIAIASAKHAYSLWQQAFEGEIFVALKTAGAHPQILLWASTGNKNPAYRDVRYIEELIGPHTVNTAPEATLAAFSDHGEARNSLTEDLPTAEQQLAELAASGIDLNQLGEELQKEGLKQFEEAFAKLMALVK